MTALIDTLLFVLDFFWWVVVLSAVFSWLHILNVVNSRSHFVVTIENALMSITEPVYRRVRCFMPDLGSLDIAPLVVLVVIYFLQRLLISFL